MTLPAPEGPRARQNLISPARAPVQRWEQTLPSDWDRQQPLRGWAAAGPEMSSWVLCRKEFAHSELSPSFDLCCALADATQGWFNWLLPLEPFSQPSSLHWLFLALLNLGAALKIPLIFSTALIRLLSPSPQAGTKVCQAPPLLPPKGTRRAEPSQHWSPQQDVSLQTSRGQSLPFLASPGRSCWCYSHPSHQPQCHAAACLHTRVDIAAQGSGHSITIFLVILSI